MDSENQKQPLFSVIIPTKNEDRYIKNALDSISSQNFSNIEVIIIDDNSDLNDISKYRVNSWKNQNPNIKTKFFQTTAEEGGPGGARNIGLDNATGKYILFLDADDVLNENALLSINKVIDENPNTDIFTLGYKMIKHDEYENSKGILKLPAGKIQESRFFQIGVDTAGQIWNTCTKRSLFGEKDDKYKIRFKPNYIFEDLPTKINLFVRNKKRIKSVPFITHSQNRRPVKSISGNLKAKNIHDLANAHYEIANIKNKEPNLSKKDRIYIDTRKVTFIAASTWLIYQSYINKLERIKKYAKEKRQILDDEITLGM